MDFWLPKIESGEPDYVDKLAMKIRTEQGIGLAAFAAVFNQELTEVLMVQLGDYAKKHYGGNPWTLPGGGVEKGERPSVAVKREIKEECHFEVQESLQLAGWFARPYYQSRYAKNKGEIVLVFTCRSKSPAATATPSPPEIIAARFQPFCVHEWLNVPSQGTSEHSLQPLPKHWVYWADAARLALRENHMTQWSYATAADMAKRPDPIKPI
ncbi:MAG: NUDIX hydrolase [Planctomycetales bacterium]|nr:NUDIX hydrolase [Planctomycetales bacterium]